MRAAQTLVIWQPEAMADGACREQLPGKASKFKPVPQTDTGIRDEYSKARELNLLKELDKLALYLRYKGCLARGRSEEVQPTV